MPGNNAKKPIDKSRRAVILATVGIVVILGLAVFYVAVVAPLREVHATLRDWEDGQVSGDEVIARLGGPERAAHRLVTYLRLPRWLGTDRRYTADMLGYIGPEAKAAVPALVKALGDSDTGVLYCVARALGKIGPEAKAAVPALVKTLGDSDPIVRVNATWALGEIGPDAKDAVPALVKALDGADAHAMRAAAALALGNMGSPTEEILSALIKALSDKEAVVRACAAWALCNLGPDAKTAVSALEKLLKDESADVRAAAASAIEKIHGGIPVPDAPSEAP